MSSALSGLKTRNNGFKTCGSYAFAGLFLFFGFCAYLDSFVRIMKFPIYAGLFLLYNIRTIGGYAMRCLKCGTNVDYPHVFCGTCVKEMDAFPVSRETPAVILPRPKPEPARTRTVKPEELLAVARRRQRIWAWLCGILLLIALALSGMLIWFMMQDHRPTGQTYTPNVTSQGNSTSGGNGQ